MEYLLEQSGDYDDPLRPVSVALRSLLDTSGGVREDARKFGDVLGSRTFVYVCELKPATEWRQKARWIGPRGFEGDGGRVSKDALQVLRESRVREAVRDEEWGKGAVYIDGPETVEWELAGEA
ncbi:hypothetical protein LTR74_004608 [Friedmanniomyces endolithicus]|nr:hypothetical protein LTR74_004608 [Friedmanniomyces endolithicus]